MAKVPPFSELIGAAKTSAGRLVRFGHFAGDGELIARELYRPA